MTYMQKQKLKRLVVCVAVAVFIVLPFGSLGLAAMAWRARRLK